jgi:hypothetical protein
MIGACERKPSSCLQQLRLLPATGCREGNRAAPTCDLAGMKMPSAFCMCSPYAVFIAATGSHSTSIMYSNSSGRRSPPLSPPTRLPLVPASSSPLKLGPNHYLMSPGKQAGALYQTLVRWFVKMQGKAPLPMHAESSQGAGMLQRWITKHLHPSLHGKHRGLCVLCRDNGSMHPCCVGAVSLAGMWCFYHDVEAAACVCLPIRTDAPSSIHRVYMMYLV